MLLQACGYDVAVASDGYEGLEKAVGEYPDIIQSRRGLAISGSAALFGESSTFPITARDPCGCAAAQT